MVKRVTEVIKRLGYAKIMLKSDQEPAIKDIGNKTRDRAWKDIEELQKEIQEGCGGQVAIQHSPVGESSSNGAVENAIQRIQGQIRAIKLDIETNSGTRMTPSHPVWPWLIEYAAQTLLYWRISGDDGLTAMQRIRGRSTTSPKPRFGEHVLYKVSKTVKLGKSEARWRRGVWLGIVELSDEHIIGTEIGVIKCRAVTSLPGDQRFKAEALEAMRGTPWKPSTKHSGQRLRTHIKEDDEESDNEDGGDDQVHIETLDDVDAEATITNVKKSQDIIFSRVGQSYSFYIKARDVLKYSPSKGCPGCKFVTGEVTTQCGHTKECKTRMMELMEKDKEDKHRIKRWYLAKGVDTGKTDIDSDRKEQDGDGAKGDGGPEGMDCDEAQGNQQPSSSSKPSSSSAPGKKDRQRDLHESRETERKGARMQEEDDDEKGEVGLLELLGKAGRL